METPFSRGSEWRKWDLHLHSDCGSPETIVAALLEEQISVFAITDHTSVENIDEYFRVVAEFQNKGQHIYYLPGVELRTDKGNKSVHIVAIFPPQDKAGVRIDAGYLRENLLAKIDCSKTDVITAGRVTSKAGASEVECYGRGLLEKVVNFESAATQIHELGGLVIVHAGSKSSGIEKEMDHPRSGDSTAIMESLGHTKRALMAEHIDICELPNWEAGNLKERDFYASTFYKPSIVCSDSHKATGIGTRYSWIKADPTFDGLRQLLNEPIDRVYLGEKLPNLKADENVIDCVTIVNSNQWFSEDPILLSDGLISIIGERGSGKTALADLIALAAGDYRQDQDENSFIKKALQTTKQIEKTIEGASVKLTWRDRSESDAIVAVHQREPVGKPRVRYLSQGFIEKKCDPRQSGEFRKEIESVIFQRLPQKIRMGATSFEELRTHLCGPLEIQKEEYVSKLKQLNSEIFAIEQGAANVAKLETEKTELVDSNKALNKQKPKPATRIEKAIESAISVIQRHKDKLETQTGKLTKSRQTILSVKTKLQRLRSTFTAQAKPLKDELSELGLSSMSSKIRLQIPAELDDSLEKLDQRLVGDIKAIEGGTTAYDEWEAGGQKVSGLTSKRMAGYSIASCDRVLRNLEAKSSVAEKARGRLNEIAGRIRNNTRRIGTITAETTLARERVESELPKLKVERSSSYDGYLRVLLKEKAVLDGLYLPLKEKTSKPDGKGDDRLEFFARIEFDVENFCRSAAPVIDFKRKGRYFQDEDLLFSDIKRIAEKVEVGGKTDIFGLLAELETGIKADVTDALPLKRGASAEDFYNWLYNPAILSVNYSLKFEGISVELLSPGKKGIILLLVYLSLDTEGSCPLIIDQPEENLDNKSVYADLMEFFRFAKERRQILVISHNPNLVINTDSEQLIVANFHAEPTTGRSRIEYVCGAIENMHVDRALPALSQSIHEQGSDILEGGKTAFIKRKRKWAF
jgi:hypothetical protein